MIKHKDQRVGVFVDVQNMYYSARALYGRHVNFGKVLEEALAGRKLIRALAYVIKTQTSEEAPFFDALEKQGFETRMKELQVFSSGQKKGDWDVGLAIDAIRMMSKLDVVVIVSGDGDYLPLVEYLQNNGLLVEVVAFGASCSMKLREAVDSFTDLGQDSQKFLMNQKHRGIRWPDQSDDSESPEVEPRPTAPPAPRRRLSLPFTR